MVQQMMDAKFNEYGLAKSETGIPDPDKLPSATSAPKRTALRDTQNQNATVPFKSSGSTVLLKENATSGVDAKVCGSKRPSSECMMCTSTTQVSAINAGSAHLVYVRRKSEADLGRGNSCDARTTGAGSPLLNNLSKHDVAPQQKMNNKEAEIGVSEFSQMPKASKVDCLPGRPSLSQSPLKSDDCRPLETSNHLRTKSTIPISGTPSRANAKYWEERYCRLQNELKILNQSKQDEYIQMLLSLSSVELSRHAVELEKRSIKLSLEEGKEVQRVKVLDILGKYPKNVQDQS